MAVNKVEYYGDVLMDSTTATVTEDTLLDGVTAMDASGNMITGNLVPAKKEHSVFYIEGNSSTAGVWTGTCEDISEYYDGLTIAYLTNIAGVSTGTTLNINGLGAKNVRRNVSNVTTHYPAKSLIHLTYVTIDGVGYWQMADYDSNTKTTAGSSNKTGTKMYLVGGTSQSSSGVTTYTNKNCYIGTDNCLYSGGVKVAGVSDLPYVNVKWYGAVGDGTTDDTAAFQSALAANRIVFVPEGTYVLSDTLQIGENSELELSQSTVLKFTQTDADCITLLRLASLKGNHATIFVPYTFSANVINADTSDDEAVLDTDNLATSNNTAVPPFTKWDPQWKMSRYVTDINICKPNASGFHYSDDGTCYGTAVFMGCYEGGVADFMWGVSMSGIRIAGGFSYGIRLYNEGETWNHDMRVEAVIDGCETGVSVENCNLAHLAVTIQPRLAFDNTKYAKYGIKLVDSLHTDLTQSFVWDWDSTKTLLTGDAPDCEYQHIAMYGNCSGVKIHDASMINSLQFWQRIYFDNLASMFNADVIGVKGRIPPDPKYAFYKNFRTGTYEYRNNNVSWHDPHNMVRYDVPIDPLNAYTYPNRLYKIGYFTIGEDAENPDGSSDTLTAETVTIEENNYFGLMGWSNLYYTGSAITHYWNPLPSVYESRVPVYFYSKSDNVYTLYRLVADQYDIQHVYNCRVSITNARRFIFDFADMGAISGLSTSTYIRLTPQIQNGTPKLAGQYSLVDGKPVVCTSSAAWSAQGAISTSPTTKQIALEEDVDEKFNTLSITAEQTDFVLPSEGEYITVAEFTDVKSPYQENIWRNDSGTMTALTNTTYGSHIYIEPRSFSAGDIIRIRGVDFSQTWPGKPRCVRMKVSDGSFQDNINIGAYIINESYGSSGTNIASFFSYTWDVDTYTLTFILDGTYAASDCPNLLLGFSGQLPKGATADTVVMTVNEEIVYNQVWEGEPKRLDESLYAQNVFLTSPNGNTFKLTVSDSGVLSATAM